MIEIFYLFYFPFLLLAGLFIYCFKTKARINLGLLLLYSITAFIPVMNIFWYLILSFYALSHDEKCSVYLDKIFNFFNIEPFSK